MLKVKLARFGKRNKPLYRVIVTDSKNKPTGKFIEIIGTYNPEKTESKLNLKKERYDYYILRGAQPTESVRQLARLASLKTQTSAKRVSQA
ncbi:MAG TPA: 30S ribosomal protein S16 [Patescibacteria group bacterium]